MMTGGEIAVVASLTTAVGAIVVGVMKIIATATNGKKTSVPPVSHGPCNEAVDRLTDAIRDDMKERKAERREEMQEAREFRLAFERWTARQDGESNVRRGRAITGEMPVVGG